MYRRVRCFVLIALLAGSATGCGGPRQADYVSTRQLTVSDGSGEADRLWDAIQETLRRHRFRLDRVDRRAGVVTTMPMMSQHFFELWRKDVATRQDFWEATLNPIRRRVEVSLTRGENDGGDQLAVVVKKERLSSPDRQFNSTGAVYQYFGDSLPSTTGLIRITTEHDRWLDLGRDAAMEDYLLGRILQQAGQTSPPEVVPDTAP